MATSNDPELTANLERAMQDRLRRNEERIALSMEAAPLLIELLDDLIPAEVEAAGTGTLDEVLMAGLPEAPDRSGFEDEKSFQEAMESWRSRVLPIIRMCRLALVKPHGRKL
jgi:hypothetical protein